MCSQRQQCHPERSRGIQWQSLQLMSRDPSTPLRFAQDDGLAILDRGSLLIRHSSFVLRR
jgi:hypothetical protein